MLAVADSGVGGLFALKALCRLCPGADYLYLADTAALPLGSKSPAEIRERGRMLAARAWAAGADALLFACGTLSAIALPRLSQNSPIPLFGIITPAADAAKRHTRTGRVLLLGTAATVRDDTFARAIAPPGRGITVLCRACPDFVSLAEGLPTAEQALPVVRACLSDLCRLGADTVVLGCTHFSALRQAVAEVLGCPHVVDGAAEAARACLSELDPRVLAGSGQRRLWASACPEAFAEKARALTGQELRL